MEKIEHVGIAVRSLEKANEAYTKMLGTVPYKTEIETKIAADSCFPNKIGISKCWGGISRDQCIVYPILGIA